MDIRMLAVITAWSFLATPLNAQVHGFSQTANDGHLPPGVAAQAGDLTFDDEFTTFQSSPDGSVGWMTCYPYQGQSARALPANGEAEYYADRTTGSNPFRAHNGILDIIASRAAPGSNPYNLPYNSGLITTFKSFAQTYGYFEIRARLPLGRGFWPAFWLLPNTIVYKSELDVFEVLGHEPKILYATTHGLIDNKAGGLSQKLSVADTSEEFHTYGADWKPSNVTFYMDGRVIAEAPTPESMNKPMYILANLAVGTSKSWPGAPDDKTRFPGALQIDYIRAYATSDTIQVQGHDAIKTAVIRGTIRPASRTRAALSLMDASGAVIADVVSDAGGTFVFRRLAAGNYQIRYAVDADSQTPAVVAKPLHGVTKRFNVGAGRTVERRIDR